MSETWSDFDVISSNVRKEWKRINSTNDVYKHFLVELRDGRKIDGKKMYEMLSITLSDQKGFQRKA